MIACRWCAAACAVVLDLGDQPAADHFPLVTDPLPDPVHPLRMALCPACGLAQLAEDATVPDEPRGVEPQALRDQAGQAVAAVSAAGLLPAGGTVHEFGSPHGGSWYDTLAAHGLSPTDGPADVVVDVFGLMHDADQRTALAEHLDRVRPGGLFCIQFHSLGAILAQGQWNALRHGHAGYYSVPALCGMLAELGWSCVGVWEFALYGGTVLLAARRGGEQAPVVTALAARETAAGVLDPARVGALQSTATAHAAALGVHLRAAAARGERVLGYGAASRAVALLTTAGVGPAELAGVVDAAPAKHGRALPGSRIPVLAPQVLVSDPPDEVLLFVGDLLAEVRDAHPQVSARGGRWVLADDLGGGDDHPSG